jgi:NAD(P)H-dependent flavin oxidoreductase YrpB (nitropropane dioxygenase family)
LAAAVSNAGGLGTLGCIGNTLDQVMQQVRSIRALTDRPFSLNFVVHFMEEDTFRAALAEQIPVFTFFRGDPAKVVPRARDAGAKTIYQITTVEEAEQACEVGVDVLIAQGNEAGGHMGPIPLLTLLPEVVAVAGSRPVLAAGGIVDGRGLAAALCLGASGVVMGTRFLATLESPASELHKQALLDAKPGDTVASPMWDILSGRDWPGGIKVRTIRNQLTARWAGREDELLNVVDEVCAQLEQARAKMDTDMILFLAGEGAGRIRDVVPAAQVVREVVTEAEQILRRVNGLVQ